MATFTRTDIHRPAAIDPTQYDYVGIEHDRSPGGFDPYYLQAVLAERVRITAHMARTGGTYSAHEHRGNCMVCGAHCVYTALWHHRPSNAYVRTGFDCADKMGGGDPAGFKRVREAADAARKSRAGKLKARGVLEAAGLADAWALYLKHCELPEAERAFVRTYQDNPGDTYLPLIYADYLEEQGEATRAKMLREGHSVAYQGPPPPPRDVATLLDVVGKLVRYGSLSEKQLNFVGVLLRKAAEAPDREAKHAAEKAAAADAPTGRGTFEVEVLKVEWKDNGYGDQGGRLVMVVKHASGWAAWGSVPSAVAAVPEGEHARGLAKGDRLALTASFEPSDRDPKFAFYKRPLGVLLPPS